MALRMGRWPALLLIGGVFSPPLHADAIIVTRAMNATTIAEIFLEEEEIRLELEIGLRDLEAFRNLLPDPVFERMGHDPEPLVERLPSFFREDLRIRPDGGEPLWGRVEEISARPKIKRDEITGEPLPLGENEEPEPVIFARIVYPLETRPDTLAFVPLLSDSGYPTAEIGFVVYHRGLPVIDFRYFGTEETLHLDWEDPWYSRFENRNLRRQYDAPISAFLYIEPYEVRKEIVLRPKDLQQWVDLGIAGKEIIPAGEQEDLKRKVVDFLREKNPVKIDGREVEGFLDRIHFLRRTLRTTGVIDPPEDLAAISATLGIIFVYPVDGLPQEATLEWELFSERIGKIPAAATDEAGVFPYFLVPDDPVLRWQNFLKNPTIPGLVDVQPPRKSSLWLILAPVLGSAGLAVLLIRHGKGAIRGQLPPRKILATAGALALVVGFTLPLVIGTTRLSREETEEILGGLLQNIYRAFDYREENLIYDSLARSAAGDLLTEVYLETRRGLELENQGGARVKVKGVEVVNSETRPLRGEKGFLSLCTWNVTGSVGHWGHIHQRTNQYQARLTVKAIEGAWKIIGLEILQEERL